MDAEVGKLAEKAENLQIKEKSPKEWNDLPLEMKEEVVKRVDFKSSLRLRQTARTATWTGNAQSGCWRTLLLAPFLLVSALLIYAFFLA